LDRIFKEAGFDWREPGCSKCYGSNGDLVAQGKRSASNSNRNYIGRQGVDAITHLMNAPMVAAAAIAGRIVDVRRLMAGEQVYHPPKTPDQLRRKVPALFRAKSAPPLH